MEELISILEKEYQRLNDLYLTVEAETKSIDEQIQTLIKSFDHVELFDEDDINEICSMLDSSLVLEFKESTRYFKLLKKCPNQPQIIKVQEILKRVVEQVFSNIMNDNKEIFDLRDEYKNKVKRLEEVIELLKNYNKDTYMSGNALYDIAAIISTSSITDNVIDLFLQILLNNNSLSSKEEDNKFVTNVYNDFITRLTNINKSMSFDSFEDDKRIVRYLNYILEEEYDTPISSDILDLIKKDINGEGTEDIIKRIKFIFHLHNVEVELEDEQLSFISDIRNFYSERLSSAHNNKELANNYTLLGLLDDDYKFTNIELLKEVLKSNDVDFKTSLFIICAIVINNSKKESINKQELLSSKELFQKYGLDTTFICEEDYELFDESIENVNEVFNLLMVNAPNLIKKIFDDLDYFEILVAILKLSSSVIINKIIKVCNEEEIDFESLLLADPSILISNGTSNVEYGSYDSFIENINFCKQNNIDIKALTSILTIDNKVLVGRYNILTNLYKIEVTGNEFLLCKPYVINTLDKYIECCKVGLNFIRDNLELLSGDCSRVIFAIWATHDVITIENDKYKLDEVLLGKTYQRMNEKYPSDIDITATKAYWLDKFNHYEDLIPTCVTSEDRVRKYVPENYDYINEEIFKNFYIKELENPKNKFKRNEFTYVINGTYISRIKFLRVCTYLYDVLKQLDEPFDLTTIKYALRFESILTEADEKNIDHFMMCAPSKSTKNKSKKKKK